jgi:hypothetical protein
LQQKNYGAGIDFGAVFVWKIEIRSGFDGHQIQACFGRSAGVALKLISESM